MRSTPPDANVLRCSLRAAWRALAVAWLATLFVAPAYAAPFLVKDINDSTQGSDPFNLMEAGGRLYFTAFHQVPPGNGAQVWRSDDGGTVSLAEGELIGKVGGAVLIAHCEPVVGCTLARGDATGASPLASILPGSFDAHLAEVTPAGARVFFTAEDSNGGALWKTDGTVAGTEAVFQFGTEPAFELTASGDVLYFARCGASSGCELWTSNGTSGGTVPVATVIPEEDENRSVFALTDVGGTLFFATCEQFGQCDLWRSNGTANGTEKIVPFNPNNDPDLDDWEPPVLHALGSRLVFNAVDDNNDKALWVTDGTEAETIRLADIEDREPEALVVGTRLYFRGVDDDGDELWVTDGTPDGTHRVADLNPGPTGSDLSAMCAGAGGIVFMACDAASGCEPWASDGTEDGTKRLADVFEGSESSGFEDCRRASGDRVYFSARSASAGRELWRTDGTPDGTAQVADLSPGPGGSNPREFVTIDDRTFFVACLPSTGCELFETDGTLGGTALFEDLEDTGAGSDPVGLTRADGFVFFLASDDDAGRELWRTDGTGPGTIRLSDVRPGFESSLIMDLTAIDGGVVFTADRVPWKSDGTVSGTAPLTAASPGDCNPGEYTPLAGTTYFRAGAPTATGVAGCELWKTNGTAAGTSLAVDIVLGPDGSFPSQLTRVGTTLFFVATDLEHGPELWKSDGTMLGTKIVKNIADDPPAPDPPLSAGLGDLTAAGGLLFFTAFNYGCGCSDIELWRSDGTEDGTFRVKDINPGGAASDPALLTEMGGILYFRACEPVTGCELWRSDGSEDGTRLVAEASPGNGDTINNLVAVGNRLFFSVRDDLGVDTLWTSDGSSTGTKSVTTLPVSSDGSSARGFTNAGGRFLYVVSDPPSGAEFWTSDGTEDGTRRVTDIWAGADSSIGELSTATLGGAVFFHATEPKYGGELWGMPLCDADPAGCPNPTTTTTFPAGTTTTTSTAPAGSTTTTTVPAGSTTTTTLAPTTTTTLPPPECTSHDQCSSDDACAEVRCILGRCTTVSAPTFERAACQLSALGGAPSCAAEQSARLDRLVRAKARTALRLVDQAKDAGATKATRLLKRARKGLQMLERRLSKSRKISTKCSTMLVGQLSAERQLLGELTPR